jgi:hypothetical protein
MPNTVNRKYATLYLLLNGRTEIDANLIKRTLSPFLDMDFETISNPVVYAAIVPTSPDPDTVDGKIVTNGAFRGKFLFNGDRIVAIKWNLMYKGGAEIPESVLGNFRQTYRNSIAPLLVKNLGLDSVDISFKHYGEAISEDKGMPPTPTLSTDVPIRPRRRRRKATPTPTPSPTPSPKPEPIVFHDTKKDDNFLSWFLVTIGSLYALRRMM